MAVSLRTELEVNAALNYVDTHDASPGSNKIYVAIGRTAVWSNELSPDVPKDNIEDMKLFWDGLIGMQLVEATDIAFVVPRNDWVTATEYFLFDETSETAYDGNFYTMNDSLEVYKCVGKVGGPGTLTTVKPVGHNGGAVIDNSGTDGYSWQYMYKITPQNHSDMMTDAWMYVNWGDSEDADQTNFGDVNAPYTLGAKYAMTRIKLVDNAGGGLPDNLAYRQLAIIRNPLDNGGVNPATGTTVLPAGLTDYTGQMLYLENKQAITRNPGQSEELKVIVSF